MNITALAVIVLGFMLVVPLSKIAHELEEIKKALWSIKK